MERLRELGLYDNSIIIFVSDHGEQFGEHDLYEHSNSLYQPLIHIPMIIKPDGSGIHGAVSSNVSLIDISPTILDFLGFEIPEYFEGRSLIPEIRGTVTDTSRIVYSEWNDVKAVFHGQTKFIFPEKGEPEVFNLAVDQAEENDMVGSNPEELKNIQAMLQEWKKGKKTVKAMGSSFDRLDPITRAQLEAMGYFEK
jgi:arylsulfatase A-like enzyme